MTGISERQAEAREIWKDCERPVWLVYLGWGNKKNRQRDQKYVRAKDVTGAILTAKANSRCPISASASAQYAHPEYDLGMVRR